VLTLREEKRGVGTWGTGRIAGQYEDTAEGEGGLGVVDRTMASVWGVADDRRRGWVPKPATKNMPAPTS